MSKRSAAELASIAKRYKKLNPREHVVQRPDMYVGPTRPKRCEGYMPNLKTFQFTRFGSEKNYFSLNLNSLPLYVPLCSNLAQLAKSLKKV